MVSVQTIVLASGDSGGVDQADYPHGRNRDRRISAPIELQNPANTTTAIPHRSRTPHRQVHQRPPLLRASDVERIAVGSP
jgi:hypothetical protein